eukprot:gb/GFBE01019328.1/.p1 GENE.gb/GFBE01019328.1/~~gb/GFBE01019328.1/.p1  ORF type:complete len:625 (+),score=95.36 gb/GFBE01019328.1/:1-1875(+)
MFPLCVLHHVRRLRQLLHLQLCQLRRLRRPQRLISATDAPTLPPSPPPVTTSSPAAAVTTLAPTVILVSPAADYEGEVGNPVSLSVANVFADPAAGDPLTLEASLADGSALPSWLSFDADAMVFTGTPSEEATLDIKVTASSTGFEPASDEFTLTVMNHDSAVATQLLTKNVHMQHAPTLAPPSFCHEDDISFEPLNMNSSFAFLYADNITHCQMKCRETRSCGHYTWYEPLKMCHLALPTALKQTGIIGFQGGPATCPQDAEQGIGNNVAKTNLLRMKCMLTNVSYVPLWGRGRPSTYVDNPIACQDQCAETDWCATFVYNTLTRACDLQDTNSTPIDAVVYEISGPPDCNPIITFDIDVHAERHSAGYKDHLEDLKGVMSSAIIRYVGNYTPFDGPVALPSKRLLNPMNVRLRVLSNSGDLSLRVSVMTIASKAFYVNALLELPQAQQGLNKQMQEYLTLFGAAAAPGVEQMGLKILGMYDLHMSATGAEYQANAMAEWSQAHPHYATVSDATKLDDTQAQWVPLARAIALPHTAMIAAGVAAFMGSLACFFLVVPRVTRHLRKFQPLGHTDSPADDARGLSVLSPAAEDALEESLRTTDFSYRHAGFEADEELLNEFHAEV